MGSLADVFSWKADVSMPHAVLLKLETRWPDVKLCLGNKLSGGVMAHKGS